MALINESNQTLAAGVAGAWFTAAGASFVADVDTSATVRLETRRGVSDNAPKPLCSGIGAQSAAEFQGPCSVAVASIASRQYRFVCVAGSAAVAADQ